MRSREARWVFGIWRPWRGTLLTIVALTLVSTVVHVSLPLVLKRIFDGFATELTSAALLSAVLLYFGLATVDWIFMTGLVFFRGIMNRRFEWAASRRAYEHLVRHAPGFFQRFRTGDLVTRLTDDVSDKLCWFICSGVFRAVAALAVIVFALAMMIRLDPFLTLLTVLPLPLLVFLFVRTGSTLDRRFDEMQERISDLNGALESCFSGIRVVKAYAREAAAEKSFERFASRCRSAEVAAAKSQILVDTYYGQVWQLGMIAVLLGGGVAVMNGRLTLGTFIAFDAYVLMLILPMLDLATFIVKGRQSRASISRLLELEENRPEIAEAADPHPPTLRPGDDGRLSFEGIGYTHPGDATGESRRAAALEDVSFELRRGQTVALAGPVGSGKSTLLRLVPRIVDPTRGRILLSGVDIRRLPLAVLRGRIGFVPQEPVLFSGTIRENISFARPEISDDAVERAARAAQLTRDLSVFADGLDTMVGERGLSLSGGQKQRVALARALAGGPSILVLDDATAALDAETESALWASLHSRFPDLSTLLVTHRTSVLERADLVLVLDRGRVAERGTHARLARQGGLYAALYRRHLLEERVGAHEERPQEPR